MNKSASESGEYKSESVSDEESDSSHSASFVENCQRLLSNKYDDDFSTHADHDGNRHRSTCVQCVHIDLRRYREEPSALPCWMDMDAVKAQLLIEIEVWSQAPIMSEKRASEMLKLWGVSGNSYRKLVVDPARDEDEELKLADLDLIYQRWMTMEPCELGLDEQAYYRVIVKRGVRNPNMIQTYWSIPMLVRAEEVRFAMPLVDCFQRGDGAQNIHFSLDNENNCVLQKNKKCFDEFERCSCEFQYVMINYQLFDSVLPDWVMGVCFDVLGQKLDFGVESQTDGKTMKEVNEKTNRRRYRMMVDHFLAMPINVCQAEGLEGDDAEHCEYTIAKTRGVPNFSCFSRIIRTMSNFVMTWLIADFVFREKPYSYRFHERKCFLVFESELEISLCAFAQCANFYFGLVVYMDRSCITATAEDFHTLKYCCDIYNGDDDDDD